METIKKEKTFDAVKMMREIRDKISVETRGMNLAELKSYTTFVISRINFRSNYVFIDKNISMKNFG